MAIPGMNHDAIRTDKPEPTKTFRGRPIALGRPADAQGPGKLPPAGTPLNEPVARWGPFVMNTREERIQAARDHETGRMGQIAPTVGA